MIKDHYLLSISTDTITTPVEDSMYDMVSIKYSVVYYDVTYTDNPLAPYKNSTFYLGKPEGMSLGLRFYPDRKFYYDTRDKALSVMYDFADLYDFAVSQPGLDNYVLSNPGPMKVLDKKSMDEALSVDTLV